MRAAAEPEPGAADLHATLNRPSLPTAKTVAFTQASRWEDETRVAQPRSHNRGALRNDRDAGRGQRRLVSSRDSSHVTRRSSRAPSESPSPAKVSAALVAAHSPEFRGKLGTAFALTAARVRDESTIEEKYADAEEELAVLRQELRREREHGFREMREIRMGWEDAEARATALERQVVYLRCSEEVLSAELGYSEELVSWWKQAVHGRPLAHLRTTASHGCRSLNRPLEPWAPDRPQEQAKLKAAGMQADLQLTGYRNRVSSLGDELDRMRSVQREEQAALAMQEEARIYLRKRISDAEAARLEERQRGHQRAEEIEAQRQAELVAHAERVGEVSKRLGVFEDQVRRMRLDVSEWAACDEAFKTLHGNLAAEVELRTDFDTRQGRLLDEEHRVEAGRFKEREAELLERLKDAVAQRADFVEEMHAIGAAMFKRKMQELSADASTLRTQLDAAEALAAAKEKWAAAQLARLKDAFRADVHAMARRLDELRAENIKQTLHLRTHGRFVSRQNENLKLRLGDLSVEAVLKRRRLRAWLGWRSVVAGSKAEKQGTEVLRFERTEKGGMIEYLQGKLDESRAKFEVRVVALQSSHAVEVGTAQHQAAEAAEALSKLKAFSAAKLRDLSDELDGLRRRELRPPSECLPLPPLAPPLAPPSAPLPAPPPAPPPKMLAAASQLQVGQLPQPACAPPRVFGTIPVSVARGAVPQATSLRARALDASAATKDDGGAKGAGSHLQLDVEAAKLYATERRLQGASERARHLERKLRRAKGSRREVRKSRAATAIPEAVLTGAVVPAADDPCADEYYEGAYGYDAGSVHAHTPLVRTLGPTAKRISSTETYNGYTGSRPGSRPIAGTASRQRSASAGRRSGSAGTRRRPANQCDGTVVEDEYCVYAQEQSRRSPYPLL